MAKSIIGADSLPEPRLAPYGDGAIYLEYPTTKYDADVNAAVLNLAERLRASGEWVDVISGYDSLVAVFNPVKISLDTASKHLEKELARKVKAAAQAPKTIDVPVFYGGKFGPDLDEIAKTSGLSKSDVIKTHSAQSYRVCMVGFVPGFTFLSEAPHALHHPRRAKPRLSVPSGSVGIAGWQTGIYGLTSPGGWQIIGRTPLKLFDAERENPFLWQAGDSLRFVPQTGVYPSDAQPADPHATGWVL